MKNRSLRHDEGMDVSGAKTCNVSMNDALRVTLLLGNLDPKHESGLLVYLIPEGLEYVS